ncbi:MAG: 50S ribosomal protein L10 [Chloroflexi bacterium RBG_16_48_7]|nr:MAG: 50S ribosomal protein L10 [Chloroflexi bacterium RBG_16_48_7]
MLKKKEKEKLITELADKLSRSTIVIATDYRGLTAKDMVSLRRQLRAAGVEYQVAKNTLTRFAADKTDRSGLDELLSGPLALAFGYDDVVKPAKVLNDFIKASGANLKIKGGLLDKKLLKPQEVVNLANTPSREVLLARLLGQLNAPIQGLHTLLSSPLRGLAYALNSIAQNATKPEEKQE